MIEYDFDTPIERKNTDCVSVELMKKETGRDDLLPLWVADMDFPTPPFVIKAIESRLKQRILGYTCAPESYYESIIKWNKRRYGLNISKESIHFVPGIVPAICFAVNCFTDKGDEIMITSPVYHPFGNVIEASGRKKVDVPLTLNDGRYAMDFDRIDGLLGRCKMFILSNPHNPGGTSWSAEETATLARLCKKHNVVLLSDEIHADMTFLPAKHVPTLLSCPEASDVTITFMAPTKAFNLPGIVASHAIIPNERLRQKFYAYLDNNDLGNGSVFSYSCVEACYTAEGEEWLAQMLRYVRGNIEYVDKFLKSNCPKITAMKPEASFLVFLDNRELGFEKQDDLVKFYIDDAGLYLNDGEMFGASGRGFMRLNVGQPRRIIEKAMNQLADAYKKRF